MEPPRSPSLGNFYCSIFKFMDSFLCLHFVVESIHCFLLIVAFQFYNIHLILYIFYFHFKYICNCLLKNFYGGCLKSLSDNAKICIILALSIDHFFSLKIFLIFGIMSGFQ